MLIINTLFIILAILTYLVVGLYMYGRFAWAFGLSSSTCNHLKYIKLRRLGIWVLFQFLWPLAILAFLIIVIKDMVVK